MDWEKYFSLNILTSPSTTRTWEFIESAWSHAVAAPGMRLPLQLPPPTAAAGQKQQPATGSCGCFGAAQAINEQARTREYWIHPNIIHIMATQTQNSHFANRRKHSSGKKFARGRGQIWKLRYDRRDFFWNFSFVLLRILNNYRLRPGWHILTCRYIQYIKTISCIQSMHSTTIPSQPF